MIKAKKNKLTAKDIISKTLIYLALVIFALWNPTIAIIGSFLFGALCNANNYIQGLGTETQELFKMLPYVATIIVLIITSMRKKREHQPPGSLGLNYFREER